MAASHPDFITSDTMTETVLLLPSCTHTSKGVVLIQIELRHFMTTWLRLVTLLQSSGAYVSTYVLSATLIKICINANTDTSVIQIELRHLSLYCMQEACSTTAYMDPELQKKTDMKMLNWFSYSQTLEGTLEGIHYL